MIMSNKKKILLLIAAVSVIVLVFCAAKLSIYSIRMYNDALTNSKLKDMVGESHVELSTDLETGRPITVNNDNTYFKDAPSRAVLDKYKTLYNLNSDIVGWVSIDDTRIDYPVMQTVKDEQYYLHRNFYKADSTSGLPFMDDRCIISDTSTNVIIYGHNMKNGTMFADLLKYQDKDFYEKHKYIRFDTIYEESLYEIVAVFRSRVAFVDEDTFRFYNFIESDTEEEFYEYYNTIRSLSFYDTDAKAISSDYLLTLSTCEYTEEDGRFVVVARKIADGGE